MNDTKHEEFLQRTKERLAQWSNVTGAYVGGSRARTETRGRAACLRTHCRAE